MAEITNSPPPPPNETPRSARKLSRMAVASLILGLLGIFSCTALVGVILGIIALGNISKSKGALRGSGIALAGVILSVIFLAITPLMLLLPAQMAAKRKAQMILCLNNEHQLALAMLRYSSDHQNQFPPASDWNTVIQPYVGPGNILKCPAADTNRICDYAFNQRLGSLDASQVNPQTVMIFESDGGWNANGGPELMIEKSRHFRSFMFAFADGHVEFLQSNRLDTLRWNP